MTAYQTGFAGAYDTNPDEYHGSGWWKRFDAGRAARFALDVTAYS